jgi:hypothetical protein
MTSQSLNPFNPLAQLLTRPIESPIGGGDITSTLTAPARSISSIFSLDPSAPLITVPDDSDLTDEEIALQDELSAEMESILRAYSPRSMPHVPSEEEEDEQSRERRMDLCGLHGWRLNPVTGRFFPIQYRCGLWRYGCEQCLEHRITLARKRLSHARGAAEGSVVAITLSESEATKFVRRLRSRDIPYRRYPGDDDTIVFDSAGAEGLYSEEEIVFATDLDLSELVLTPEHRRVSGKLGAIEEDPNYTSITTEQVYAAAGDMEIEDCVIEAQRRTAHLDPQTIEEVQEACDIRVQALKDIILETGGTILYTQDVHARVSDNSYIDW